MRTTSLLSLLMALSLLFTGCGGETKAAGSSEQVLSSIEEAVKSVKDSDTAKSAVETINKAGDRLKELYSKASTLDAGKMIANATAKIPSLTEMLQKVGNSEVVKPVVEAVKNALTLKK